MIYDVIIYTVFYDIWFYFSHILLHKSNTIKYIHKEHHKTHPKNMIYTDTYIAHIYETPIQSIGIFVPLLFMKFYLFRFICTLLFLNIRGTIRHDHRFVWVFGNHHLLHHEYPQYNYGEYWLDYIFGTNYPNKKEFI